MAATDLVAAAQRLLVVGIGGGGDVVGSYAVALAAEALGTDAVVGGLTWERRPVDPLPGPRRLDEVVDAEALNAAVALARPETSGPGGFRFCEAHLAGLLDEDVVLVDPTGGPAATAAGLADAATRLGCDVVVLLDVGGDVLAHGDEPGLASPLADAVLLATAPALEAAGLGVLGVVFGIGCDGELKPAEVLERLEEVRSVGGDLGDLPLPEGALDRLDAACAVVPTEASAMAVRCARGEVGDVPIRQGRRTVPLTPDGGRLVCFDPAAAMRSAAKLAAALVDSCSLEHAHDRLTELGVRTELAYERDAAAAAPPSS
ncbi:DUF1152 domain-containing protein [Conexibacter sp. SYSU D00693]|uniref:DUF1152 domain-containing protein n=1 Tax=Conexibacter sp. SYSU D00693 TaxID=2812560 RepID=UPI00196B4934|nr:DUF1152 domain-containing protein [Conexibacter sp. SYSU D00693]